MSETHEMVPIAKTPANCGLCEGYAAREAAKPVVVLACEGTCLRGELARLTANILWGALLIVGGVAWGQYAGSRPSAS